MATPEEIQRLKQSLGSERDPVRRADLARRINDLENPPSADTGDGDDSSGPFGVPLDDDNQPTTPPTRGEKGVAELTDAARDDLARVAEQERAAAETPPQEASVTPEAAVPKPGIAGDVTPAQTPPTSPASDSGDQGTGTPPQSPQIPRTPLNQPDAEGQARQNLWDRGKNWFANKFTKEALMAVLKAIGSFLLTNGWWILLIVVVIALFAWAWNSYSSGANGKTPAQAVNAIDNKSALEKLALLAGDRDTQQKLSSDVLTTKILPNLTALKDKTTDDALKKQIDDALKAANDCASTPPKTDACTGLIDLIKAILAKFDDPIPPTQGRAPVNPEDMISGGHFNAGLHLGTPLHPTSSTDTNSAGHGTYIYTGENKGDGVDVYTKGGAKVYPAFKGEIVDVSSDANTSDNNTRKIVIKNGDYQILYAFVIPEASIEASFKKGEKITITDLNKPIGTTSIDGISLVHIEFTYCAIPLVTSLLDKLDHDSSSPKYTTWGEYYWAHLKKVLKF
ncbi:MAG: hypothetical protein Q7S80_02135 [bacterium]|nr:hypothetical protein [bacterium]